MSKAVLILEEMPENCAYCPCFYDEIDKCQVVWKSGYYEEKRPSWCPLRRMPDKLRQSIIKDKPVFEEEFIEGWNRCLEVIENE